MAEVACDVMAKVRFFSVVEGGLEGELAPTLDRLGCLFRLGDHQFDCFLLATNTRPGPGAAGDLPIVFLTPELAKPQLRLGSRFVLQHATPFAEGEIINLPWISDYAVKTPGELYGSIGILKKLLAERAQGDEALGLERALSRQGSDDETFAELRSRLLALPKHGIYEEPAIKWRVDRAIRYVDSRLNAWPSTAVR